LRIKREDRHAIVIFEGADWNKNPKIGIARPLIGEIKKLQLAHRHYSGEDKTWLISEIGMRSVDAAIKAWIFKNNPTPPLEDWEDEEKWLSQFDTEGN
jgi:hypothetical protein